MNRPQFARHLSVIQNDYERGDYEKEGLVECQAPLLNGKVMFAE